MRTSTTAPTPEHRANDVRQLPVRMPKEVYDALKSVAYFTKRSMNGIVVGAIVDYLRNSSDEEMEAIVAKAREDYHVVLEKLADL